MWNDEEGAAKAVTVHGVEVGLVTTGYKKEEAVMCSVPAVQQ